MSEQRNDETGRHVASAEAAERTAEASAEAIPDPTSEAGIGIGDPESSPATRWVQPQPATPATNGPSETRTRRLQCTASGPEYFRIWIANVALTLLTLGIYSAWAKVRARRYFYGNVWLGDDAFAYTANPVAILRGRILVVIAAGALWFANLFSPLYYFLGLLVLAPLVPWIIVRARGFQLRNSRHRGIAFSFDGRYPEAAVWYFVMPLVSAFTLGLAWPYRVHGRDRFLAKESRFGDRPFRFTAEAGQYYAVFFTAWVMAGLLLVGSCFALLVDGPTVDPEPSGPLLTVLMQVLFALGALAIFVYIRTRLLSYRWSSTQIGESDLILRLSFRRMLWLNLSNTALIVLTLGLFAPFARIRVLRYIVDRFLVMQPVGEVTVAAGERQRLDAAGAEAASEFGFEIGI